MRYAVAIAAIVLVTLVVGRVATGTEASKIGVVDVKRVYDENKFKQGHTRALEELLGNVEKERDERRQKIEAMKREMFLLSDEHRGQKQEEITAEETKLSEYLKQAQKRFQELNASFLQEFEERVTAIVEEVATAEGLDLVLNKNAVIYNKTARDLTDMVIEKLNALFEEAHAAQAPETPSETTSEKDD